MFEELLQQLKGLLNQNTAPISLLELAVNLGLGFAISLLLSWHYRRYANSLANRADLAKTFPLIVLATILIITIVKSSIALSLGLVGALSIVRFRTPIKEPEELAYLFLAISVGLGLGAGQGGPTLLAVGIILVFAALLRRKRAGADVRGIFVTATWDGKGLSPDTMTRAHDEMMQFARDIDIRRMDVLKDRMEMVTLVDLQRSDALTTMLSKLRESHPDVELSVVDQHQIPGV